MRWFLVSALVVVSLLVSSRSEALRILPEVRVSTEEGSDRVLFALVEPPDGGASSFQVSNIGRVTLTISKLELFGNDAGVFELGPLPKTTLMPAEAQTVTVRFSPVAVGDYSARVVLESDAARNSDLVLCGTAVSPGRAGVSGWCDAPEPPPLPAPAAMPMGCSSLASGPAFFALALVLMRRRTSR